MNKYKIAFVCNFFMPEKIAGTEIYTLNLAKGLQKRGHEVFILIPNFDVTQNETYYFEEVKVIKFAENTPVRRAVLTGMIAPEGVANFRSTLEQEKPDFIHFQDMTGSRGISMYHVKAAKKPGSRTLITMHLSGYTCDTGLLFRKGSVLCDGRVEVEKCAACSLKHSANKDGIVNYVLVKLGSLMNKLGIDPRKWHNRLGTSLGFPSRIQQKLKEISGFSASFDQIISITEWYRAILLLNDVPADKITYIPQALPSLNDKEHDNVSEVPASSSMVRLLFVGRIIPLKGLDLLLSAVKKLPQEKFSLTIIGKKDDPLYFEKCIRLAENQSNIFWKGPVDDRAELSRQYRSHDALCLPSLNEMSPLVIQEAFACQLPVVASDIYGNREQIKHGKNGLLFRYDSAAELNKTLQKLIEVPDILAKLKENIVSPPNFEDIVNAHQKLYEQLAIQTSLKTIN